MKKDTILSIVVLLGFAFAVSVMAALELIPNEAGPAKIKEVCNTNFSQLIENGTNITDASITGAKLVTNTVTTTNMVPRTLQSTNLALGAVTTAEIRNRGILATNIQTGVVTRVEIATNTITTTNMLPRTLYSTNIALNTIGTNNMAQGAGFAYGSNDIHFAWGNVGAAAGAVSSLVNFAAVGVAPFGATPSVFWTYTAGAGVFLATSPPVITTSNFYVFAETSFCWQAIGVRK